jgi:2-polyprenyl-6-methoxyphenol hydroxylase-like FAD-dependent oxidoreductase
MARLQILISGAGIAGCTLAYWLLRNGHAVSVVERGRSLRSSGSPVDVRGAAVEVVERMNIAAQLREARIQVKGMTLLDEDGQRITRVNLEAARLSIAPKDMELARGDLARILHEASKNGVDYIFGDSIKAMAQDEGGVDVSFEHSPARRFDLVVGADGLHSIVRRLAFGADTEFVRHAGLYAATIALPALESPEGEMFMLNTPGKLVALHPCQDKPLAYFVFWRPEIREFNYIDLDQHKNILEGTFKGMRWRVPEFLEIMRASPDIYFDSVSRVDVENWARGRIVLLGDASSCVSLFGDGSTLAICGAYELAEALTATRANVAAACSRYQEVHQKLVASKQKNLVSTASRIVPRTRAGIWVSTRLFWRSVAAVATIMRLRRQWEGKSI